MQKQNDQKLRGSCKSVMLSVLITLSGCAGIPANQPLISLKVAGPPIEAAQTGQPFIYKIPTAIEGQPDDGLAAQAWSMLGREDRSAKTGVFDYTASPCEPLENGATGWDGVLDAITAQAASHRIVIINESHSVTLDREFIRQLLPRLRPLGFTVYAAETFSNTHGKIPVDMHADMKWAQQNDGFYSREPSFGRLISEAKSLGYRLAAYEQIFDANASKSAVKNRHDGIAIREAEEARHLADILKAMGPKERLLVHVGYDHATEVPVKKGNEEDIWMAARLKALTGIDPLTVTQTTCRSAGGVPFLAKPPKSVGPGFFDLIVSKPLEKFVHHRPAWRMKAGDLEVAIPQSLRPVKQPLILEAFARGEPFNSVPIDRVYVEPGEDIPLLLPPGHYTIRAVRPAPN